MSHDSATTPDRRPADLALVNAKVWTGGASFAAALAVRGGRIVAVGGRDEVDRLTDRRTRVIDAGGRLVLPGFNDAHVHLLPGGFSLRGVDLRPARDEAELAAILSRHVAALPPGQWVTGGQWDHENWPSRRWPSRDLVDRAAPRNPVLLRRLDGHIAVANSLALKLAGLSAASADPPGGQIVRDPANGQPTGILIDTAFDLAMRSVPPPSSAEMTAAARAALAHAAALGVTSVQSITEAAEFAVLRNLGQTGELTANVYAMTPYEDWAARRECCAAEPILPAGPSLRRGAIKLFADGSLGAASALLGQPYDDHPGSCGLAIHSEERLAEIVHQVDAAGRQVALHAIGDRAVAWALAAFERTARLTGRRQARHRIEHAQVVQPADRGRFAALGVIASLQPSHCIDDMRWVERRLGGRAAWAYPFASLLRAGATVACGTDWYVEPLDPLLTVYAAVTREFAAGGPAGGWNPEERVTVTEALTAYTRGSAWAEFQEEEKGSIAAGRLADLVIMSHDLFAITPCEIPAARVEATIVGGRVVYERNR